MVTVDEIVKALEQELVDVESVNADEACKEEIENIYKRFYAEKDRKIAELNSAINSIQRVHDTLEAEQETETEDSVDVGV